MNNRITISAFRGYDVRYVARVALGDCDSIDEGYNGCLITAAMANPGFPKLVTHLGENIGTVTVSGWSVIGKEKDREPATEQA